jgi:hypothetical protein
MRKRLIICGALILGGAILGAIAVRVVLRRLPGYVRERTISTLRERFQSDVQFASLDVSVELPRIRITGQGLVLRKVGGDEAPPLIQITRFSAEAGLLELLRPTKHVGNARLEGLWIQVPPRRKNGTTPASPGKPAQKKERPPFSAVMDEIISDQTQLDILSAQPGKPPLSFEIHHLTLHDAGLGQPMIFHAELTNPRPPGEIVTTGHFGPWQKEEPRLTPLSGSYTFKDADLGTFRGIAGILSSDGKYKGTLERVEVDGETATPDFRLSASGHPISLKTNFHSIVDGTNGNTLLQPVRAQFLRSLLLASGSVARTPGVKGRTVSLDVTATQVQVEDLVRLVSKAAKPPLTGLTTFKAKFELPPAEGDVLERLKLTGEFRIDEARFTDPQVEQRLEELSQRGKGQPHALDAGDVLSDFNGKFVLRNGVMAFSDLTFRVPGASVLLKGQYSLPTEEFDFSGTLRLQATISQMVGGWKSILLKPLDPLFKRAGAGTVIPIRITGTGNKPVFSVEVGRALMRKNQ